ncbi:MAG TPA: family 1 encapsulin nanocompartment shell protein [Polyangiales bacterium]|nr:family 1 encapsulin nanocompartment shell protein [Polyangiales bacterium]
MHSDLVELGWTEEHFNRIYATVTEEAQKARVAAQVLSLVGPLDPTAVATPRYALNAVPNPRQVPAVTALNRLEVDSDPTLFLTKIALNVYLHNREAADPSLTAALTVFRRAANYMARIEDALIFNGRPGPGLPPPFGIGGIPNVYTITGNGTPEGVIPFVTPPGRRRFLPILAFPGPALGDRIINAIIRSINLLDAAGQLGPYACVLSPNLFAAVCTPNNNLVLPRDRILPFLQGPLLRSSAVFGNFGVVVALSAAPLELVVGSDTNVLFLQRTEEARLAFQVSERVALRVKESAAIAILV